jgi:hypothetical protein
MSASARSSLSDGHVFAFCVLLVVTLFVHKVIHVLPMICKKRKKEINNNGVMNKNGLIVEISIVVFGMPFHVGIRKKYILLLYDFEHSCGVLPA